MMILMPHAGWAVVVGLVGLVAAGVVAWALCASSGARDRAARGQRRATRRKGGRR